MQLFIIVIVTHFIALLSPGPDFFSYFNLIVSKWATCGESCLFRDRLGKCCRDWSYFGAHCFFLANLMMKF